MKLKYLRLLMAAVLVLEAAAVIAKWYLSNGGWTSGGSWLYIPIIALGLLLKALDSFHRCPHCRAHLEYKKLTRCPHCKEPIE